MPRFRTWTVSVEAGELAPEYRLRTDAIVRNKGLLRARNIRLLSGGGWEKRWGTRRVAGHSGPVRYETIGLGERLAVLFVFGAGRLDIYDTSWTLLQSITSGCPWVAGDLRTMQVASEYQRVTVASRSFATIEISRSGTTWSVAPKAFAAGQGGTVLQPYWRFQQRGVTLTPSGLSGSITLTTSADHWVADHVGARVRYQGQEITITAVASAASATGTVVSALFPTLSVPVVSSSGFTVGDLVRGKDSEVEGLVTDIPSGTSLTVLLTSGFQTFIGTGTPEDLVGPNQQTKLTADPTSTTPATALDWDEQLISAARGYPGGVAYHRGRQILYDFEAAPNLLAASAPGDPDDFGVGDGNVADAVVETVGRDSTLRIRFVGSMEQLLVFTDSGSYYVPETVGAPFAATNAEFLHIGPEAIGQTAPVRVAEGMMFCEAGSGRMLVLLPTGNVRRSWDVADLSELSFHLMADRTCGFGSEGADLPFRIEVMSATAHSDREIVVLKADGTAAWLRYRRGQDVAGWCPWDTTGQWISSAVFAGSLVLCAFRNGAYSSEYLDPCAVLDGCSSSATATWTHLANQTVFMTKDLQAVRQGALNGSGVYATPESWWGTIDAGFHYSVEVEYPPPIDGENGQMRPMQIVRVFCDVVGSSPFRIDNFNVGRFGGPVVDDALPPLTTTVMERWIAGFGWSRTVRITQDEPGPLRVQAFTMEVKS
jgi:hypothetical protein